jgi:hypothetical protein
MVLAFVVGSPFVVLDAPLFVKDFLHQSEIMSRGWLGFEKVGNGFWYNLHTNLGGGMGMVLVVLGIAGIAWAFWRRTRLDLMVAPYVVLYYLYISTWKELADRYLLPIAPLVILFAVRFCLELAGLRPSWRRVALPVVAAVLAVACILPLASAVSFDRGLSGTDTRTVAMDWIERTIPPDTVIAMENYSPQLVGLSDRHYFRQAGIDQKAYRIVAIPLPLPDTPIPQRSMGFLASKHVRYVIVSSEVYDRVFAAAGDYPRLADFYRQLEQTGTLVKEFRPGPGGRGPVLKIYRLPPGV